jgi:hypothetical protein
MFAVMNTGQQSRPIVSFAGCTSGRAMGCERRGVVTDTATLRSVTGSSLIRDEIAPELCASAYSKVCFDRGSIKRRAFVQKLRRLP